MPRTYWRPGRPIAANLGHSATHMTERHYAHLVPSHVAQVIRATMPKLGLVEPSPAVSPTTIQRVRSQQACASARKPVRIRDAGRAPNEAVDRFKAPVSKFYSGRSGAYR
jgi:hypothetical protein